IDTEPQIVVRHELGLAHGAGPAALEAGTLAAAIDDDVEGVLQLVLGPVAAAAVEGECGQRADDVAVALDLAEAGFVAPDRHEDFGGNAEPLADRPRHGVDASASLCDAGGRGG